MIKILGFELQLNAQWEFLANPVATFFINLAAWCILSLVIYWGILPLLKRITRFLPGEVEDIVLGIIRRPISLLVFVIGIRLSIRYLELTQPAQLLLSRITMTIIILLIGHIVGRIIRDVLVYYGGNWARRTESQVDDILIPVLSLFGPLLLVTIAGLIILPMWGVDISSVLVGAGVLGVVLGLALQETLSNIFSGLGLLIEAPFKLGDLIRLTSGQVCEVQRLGLRSTTLLSLEEQATIFMPNKLLATDYLVNLTKPTAEQRYSIQVAVDACHDLARVQQILYSIAVGHPAVMSTNIQVKIPLIQAQVERIRERIQRTPENQEASLSLLTLAQNNEAAISRLAGEAQVNIQLGTLKEEIRELIRGIRARETAGLSRLELGEILLEYAEPVENRIQSLIQTVKDWVDTPDRWLWDGDFWALKKMWQDRNDALLVHWESLKQLLHQPDDRLEFRLDDLSASLIDWLDSEYKIVPGPWKDPVVEVKSVSTETCELALHYYVDNIRLEMDGRPRRIHSELNHLIREEFLQAGIWQPAGVSGS